MQKSVISHKLYNIFFFQVNIKTQKIPLRNSRFFVRLSQIGTKKNNFHHINRKKKKQKTKKGEEKINQKENKKKKTLLID